MTEQILEMRLFILKDVNESGKDALFTILLNRAKSIAFNILYPFQEFLPESLPSRYTSWQTRCAIELYNSLGTEGISSYSENQISWSKLTDGISKSLLNELQPFATVPREDEYVS